MLRCFSVVNQSAACSAGNYRMTVAMAKKLNHTLLKLFLISAHNVLRVFIFNLWLYNIIVTLSNFEPQIRYFILIHPLFRIQTLSANMKPKCIVYFKMFSGYSTLFTAMHANGNTISVPGYTLKLAITNLYLYSNGDPEGVTGIFH